MRPALSKACSNARAIFSNAAGMDGYAERWMRWDASPIDSRGHPVTCLRPGIVYPAGPAGWLPARWAAATSAALIFLPRRKMRVP